MGMVSPYVIDVMSQLLKHVHSGMIFGKPIITIVKLQYLKMYVFCSYVLRGLEGLSEWILLFPNNNTLPVYLGIIP